MLVKRKRRPLDRQVAVRDARLIVLATEGEKTEQIYFESFANSRVQIVVIPSSGGRSAPRHILANLMKFKEDYQLFEDDELWLVIDKDRWPVRTLHEVFVSSKQAGFQFAVSNPCFEVWLSYHYPEDLPSPVTREVLVKHLKKVAGSYSKSKYNAASFVANVQLALSRAKQEDKDPRSPWPEPRGSRVYKIVAALH